MTGISAEREAQIEARCNAATHGPWTEDTWDDSMFMRVYGVRGGVAQVVVYECNCHVASESALSDADLAFIAHARADVPDLLAALRAERAVVDAVLALHQPHLGIDGIGCTTCGMPMRLHGGGVAGVTYPCPTVATIQRLRATPDSPEGDQP